MRLPAARRQLLRVLALAVLPAAAALGPAAPSRAEPELLRPYRADREAPLPTGVPVLVRALLPAGSRWPAPLVEELEARIRAEWVPHRLYGPVHSGAEVWLEHPLVAARRGGETLVPVVSGPILPERGRVVLPESAGGPRRVVLLVDASSSANARTPFRNEDGTTELVSVLEAEHRALAHLLEQAEDEWLELGILAFGEGTWPIAEPGTPRHELARRLERFRRERPRGEGRTDTVCALWTAWDWLRDTPKGVERHVVLLTDGDLPHSGRFLSCRGKRGEAKAACEARRNQTRCPAQRRLRLADGRSDLKQLARLRRKLRKKLVISPVVFEADRRASEYRRLAEATGGRFVQVPSAQGIEVALPPLVAGRLDGVRARHLGTGEETPDLLGSDGAFAGELGLTPGPNDVELRVESDRGPAALFRFRVYSAPGALERYLARLRERNRSLESRAERLVREASQLSRPPTRSVEVTTD